MRCYLLRPKSVFLACVLAGTSATVAFAIEAEDVGERLKELLAQQQVELSYDNAEMSGSDVTLSGVVIDSPAEGEGVPLGTLTLQDVTEENGAYRIGTLAMDDFRHQEDGVTVSMSGLVISGLLLPADAASDPFAGAMRYDRMNVERIDVSGEEGDWGTLENVYANLTVAEDQTLKADGGVEAFSLNLQSLMEDDEAEAAVEAAGYGQVAGSARMEGSWRPSDGRVTLSRYEATVDDAGTLFLMVDFAGYTPEFIATLEEMSENMEQGGGQNSSAQGMAMLGMMQQLTFHGLTIRFTDDSLTGKLLDYAAQQQGAKPQDVIAQVKAVIPLQLAPFIGNELAQNLAQAVGTFLENPQNLEISAQPGTPVPFAMLMGAAMGAPEMLIKQIGLTVKANQ